MYKVDDDVFYKGTGLCRVTAVRPVKLGGCGERVCYVLRPHGDPDSTVYIPVDNDELSELVRPVMTRLEAEALIDRMPDVPTPWIDNERDRSRDFLAMLRSCDSLHLVRLVRTLYLERIHRKEQGRTLGATDTKIMAAAERLLHEELAFVLGIVPGEVIPYIQRRLSGACAPA